MTFKEFQQHINNFAAEHPEALDFEVISKECGQFYHPTIDSMCRVGIVYNSDRFKEVNDNADTICIN